MAAKTAATAAGVGAASSANNAEYFALAIAMGEIAHQRKMNDMMAQTISQG